MFFMVIMTQGSIVGPFKLHLRLKIIAYKVFRSTRAIDPIGPGSMGVLEATKQTKQVSQMCHCYVSSQESVERDHVVER